MTLAILLLGLIIATSFIAYWADNLGKKLGKKRISLFGIRPKQTATLISIVSSVAIMLLTVGVLMATFSNLRNALLRYDSAKRTAVELRAKNSDLLKNVNGLRDQRRTLDSQLKSLQKKAREAKVNRQEAIQKLTKVRANLEEVRDQLEATTKAEKLARQGEKDAKAKAHAAQQRYAEIAARLKDAQTKVASSRELLVKSINQLQSTHKLLAKTKVDFKAAHQQLAKANEQLEQTQKSLATVQQNFQLVDQQVKVTLDQYRDAARNVETLKQRRDDLETQLKLRQQQLAGLEFVAYQVATGNVEVAYGTVFAQTLVPSKTSFEIAKAQLQALMEAGQIAVQGKYNLSLAPQRIYVGQQIMVLNAEQIVQYWAEQLSNSDAAVSARLVAARDHAVGEHEILTRFILVPIHTIFQKGQVVEKAIIDSSAGDARIFNQLLRLINQGEAKAREQGSMPITTVESPFYAAGTNERIFVALREIQTFTGPVQVTMTAAEDITTVDSMQVRFTVSAEEPSES